MYSSYQLDDWRKDSSELSYYACTLAIFETIEFTVHALFPMFTGIC